MAEVKSNREEVDSHSSKITNDRIADIKTAVWKAGFASLSNITSVDCSLAYFAACAQLHNETLYFYHSDANTKFIPPATQSLNDRLSDCLASGFRLVNRLRLKVDKEGNHRPSLADNLKLIFLCYEMQTYMNIGMQKLKYFFRTGIPDPKGVDQMLEKFKSDIWGGKDEVVDSSDGIDGSGV